MMRHASCRECIIITSSQLKKFGLLTSLYIAQGLPYGFFTQALPSLLREQGISLQTIGLGALLTLPWALKWLVAPVVDQQQNHRNWIITTNLLSVGICLFLSTFSLAELVKERLWLLYAGFFMLNLTAAMQDIATDALAVLQLEESERGIGNGVQVAGYRVGMIISGGALLAWFSVLGWNKALMILAALLFLATLPILWFKPAMPLKPAVAGERFGGKSAFWLLLHKESWIWLAALCLYKFGENLAIPMLRPMLVDQGRSLSEMAYLLGTIGFGAGLLGAMLGAVLISRFGHRLTLRAFLLFNATALLAYAYIAATTSSTLVLQIACGIEHLSGGMATVALFTEMMYHCRPQHEATDYTLQSCLTILVNITAGALSGFIAQQIGYTALFILCACITFAMLPLVMAYQGKRHLLGANAHGAGG
jgi:MFS transporter, PAT family, beta-lactamase induction signal transducer AmpG